MTIDEILNSFEENQSPLGESDISEALRKIDKASFANNQKEEFKYQAETMAFDFYESSDNESVWGTYYGPMAVFKNDEDIWVEAPSIKLVTPEILKYWEQRAQISKNPLMKNRYADLVWDFTEKVTGEYPNFIMAQTTVDSGIGIIQEKLYKYATHGIKKIGRSLSIALSINDRLRIEAVRDAMIIFEDEIAEDSKPGLWGFCFDELVDNKKVSLSEEQSNKIVQDMEKRLERVTVEDTLNTYAAQIAAIRLARYYRKWNRVEDFKRILSKYGEAVIKTTSKVEPMVGAMWIEELYNLYYEYGLREDADKLTNLMRELGEKTTKEMKTISEEFSIPKDEMERFLKELTEGGLYDVFTRIVGHFLPNPEEVKQQVIDLSKESPLLSFIPFTIMDWEGRPVAKIGPLEDDLDGRIINQMSQNISISSVFLRATIDRMLSKFNPSVEDIVNYFFQSPLYTEENKDILLIGIKSYLAGEHLIAAHVLIPQLEHAIRQLLKLLGGPIYRPGRNGALYLRNLDELLRDENIISVIGESVSHYLRVLLTDQRGWNLRNDICHSTIRPERFSWSMTDRIFHVLLLLAQIHEKS